MQCFLSLTRTLLISFVLLHIMSLRGVYSWLFVMGFLHCFTVIYMWFNPRHLNSGILVSLKIIPSYTYFYNDQFDYTVSNLFSYRSILINICPFFTSHSDTIELYTELWNVKGTVGDPCEQTLFNFSNFFIDDCTTLVLIVSASLDVFF